MRACLLALLVVLGACTAPAASATPTPSATHEPGTLNVSVLLDLTGSRASLGAAQRDALQMWTDQRQNATPRVRLRTIDLASNPSRLVIELRRATIDEHADAIVVGAAVDYDDTVARAVQLTQLPVLFTLPIKEPAVTAGGWGFALAPTPAKLARATLDHAALRTPLTSAMVVSDESATAIVDRAALVAELARRGLVANVSKATAVDISRLRASLAGTSAAFFAGPAKPYLDAARGAGPATLLYFSYWCELADIGELRETAANATWPGSRWIAAGAASGARVSFVRAYTDRAGPPNSPAASAFDALSLLANAARDGSDAAQMRERLESSTLAGMATTYSFTASRHAGFTLDDLAFLRYAGPRASPVLR